MTDPERPAIYEQDLRHILEEVCRFPGGDVRCYMSVSRECEEGNGLTVEVEVLAGDDAKPETVMEEIVRRISCISATNEAVMHMRVLRVQSARRADPAALEEVCRTIRESGTPFNVETYFGKVPDAGVWVSGVDGELTP